MIVFDKLMAFDYFLARILFDLIAVKLSFCKGIIFIRPFILHVIIHGAFLYILIPERVAS